MRFNLLVENHLGTTRTRAVYCSKHRDAAARR